MNKQDHFGALWTCSDEQTIHLWDAAMAQYLDFSGTPVGDVQAIDDPAFLAGPAYCAAMKLLSGLSPETPSLQKNLSDMRAAMTGGAEDGHARAVILMTEGEPSAAAAVWDEVLAARPHDILAHKCAHETWFLIGNIPAMVASARAALDRLDPDHPCFAVAAAQYGFALEESGDCAGAESWARLALAQSPRDAWALHCLAHVYETQNRHADSMALIEAKKPIWQGQNLFSAHIWWHLALRLIEVGATGAALAVFDDTLVETKASNQFRLTDGTSLLWRLQLAGVDVGDRWRLMADKWAKGAERHENAFLDLHGAFAFTYCPDHIAAARFFETLDTAFTDETSEMADLYARVARPLIHAIRKFPTDKARYAAEIAPLLPDLHRVGGSIVQREIVERSFTSALMATGQAPKAAAYLDPKLATHPNTPWLLRDRAATATQLGDIAQATLLNRRADAMFQGWA